MRIEVLARAHVKELALSAGNQVAELLPVRFVAENAFFAALSFAPSINVSTNFESNRWNQPILVAAERKSKCKGPLQA
jgi:hypothetical protein